MVKAFFVSSGAEWPSDFRSAETALGFLFCFLFPYLSFLLSEALARIHSGERGVYPRQGHTATKRALGFSALEDNRIPSAIVPVFS